MAFYKKTLLMKEEAEGFSKNGKKVSGVVNIFYEDGKLWLSATFLNLKDLTEGEYFFKMATESFCSGKDLGRSVYSVEAEFSADGKIKINPENLTCDFILFYKNSAGIKAVAFADGLKKHSAAYYEKLFEPKAGFFEDDEQPGKTEKTENQKEAETVYDDEKIAEENYYEFEKSNKITGEDGGKEEHGVEDAALKKADEGKTAEKNVKTDVAEDEGDYFETESGKFFESVKGDIEAAFDLYETDEYLTDVIPDSRFVKVTGDKEFSFGVIREAGEPKYVCYGIKGEYSKDPPEKLKGIASFVPKSIYDDSGDGYWVIFQDAKTGKCIRTDG